jgi:hypothetical protein
MAYLHNSKMGFCLFCNGTVMCQGLDTGFVLATGFAEHLKIVLTINYNTLANTCTKLFITAHVMSFMSS